MVERRGRPAAPRVSARLRLAMSYAAFLVAAGAVVLVGVYAVLRYVPDYPLTAANPRDAGVAVVSREEILSVVVRVSGAILFALGLIGVSGGWVLAGWVLRPLHRINDAARVAATGRLDQRIELTGRNDEFRQVADSFDDMLDRLSTAFEAQQRFAANASHELRTPLAVTATMLDVARRGPHGDDVAKLIERLTITNTRAIGLCEALLRLADAESGPIRSEPVDLAHLAATALDDCAPEADQQQIRVHRHLDTATTTGDPALLAQLTVNLVQNACRHNVAGGDMIVRTGPDGRRGTVLHIENDGPLYTDDEAARLHEPFLRGAGRVSDPSQGARGYGLGLALVARIVDVHHGSLTVRSRSAGGLHVTVSLPSAPV